MKPVGVIHQNFQGYLDHIAPLCCLLDMPLLVTEKKIASLAEKFYPNIKVILHEDYTTFFPFLGHNFNVIFSCQILYSDPATLFSLQFYSDDFTLVWLPHGHSDKGWHSNIFKALEKEKITLVYGNRMIDVFEKQNVKDKIENIFSFGNYRYHFYKNNKEFYDKFIKTNLSHNLEAHRKNILYAPTWNDYEENSSFDHAIDILTEKLPNEYNLIIKPHPNTYLKNRITVDALLHKYQNHPNILILNDFPPIYSLLDITDIYLGDMSSIGYDFLTFNKPMFFLNKKKRALSDPGAYLYQCGHHIHPSNFENVYEIINKCLGKQDHLHQIRTETYTHTFDTPPNFKKLKESIKSIHFSK